MVAKVEADQTYFVIRASLLHFLTYEHQHESKLAFLVVQYLENRINFSLRKCSLHDVGLIDPIDIH